MPILRGGVAGTADPASLNTSSATLTRRSSEHGKVGCVRGHIGKTGEHPAGDGGTIRVFGHRRRQRFDTIGWSDVCLPAAGDQHMPLLSGIGEEPATSQVNPAAVGDEVEQHTTRFGNISRLEDSERRCVFHHPAGVAWRKFEVGNDGVERQLGIEFAIGVSR